jgi:PTS system nitrogen regulatory IIA component
MNLSVRDVAELLNVSEKTIYRMIKDETIPCFRVGGQWRFDRREIASWIEDTREFNYTAAKRRFPPDEESISVTEFLRRGGIYYNVAGETRETAIMSCLDLIKSAMPRTDRIRLFESIMDRENLCSTAIGNGIAFPHPRRPFQEFAASLSSIALCRLKRPIPFGALDNEDIDTLFFIFPKSERRFLRIQAKLLRLLKDDHVMSAVKGSVSADHLFTVFSGREAEIFGTGKTV